MKNDKKTTVSYSNSAKINIGNYEQLNPYFMAKSEYEKAITEEEEQQEFSRLKSLIDYLLDQEVKKVKNGQDGLRFREKDGKKYPSVTFIIHPDPIPMEPEKLRKYAHRGVVVEDIFKKWMKTGVIEEPSKQDVDLIDPLKFEDIKYHDFIKEHGSDIIFNEKSVSQVVYNEKFLYSGEKDIQECIIGGKKTLVDIKTGSWDWKQLVAYWLCDEEAEQLAVFDLKKNKLELLDPKSKRAFTHIMSFMVKRGVIKERYGV